MREEIHALTHFLANRDLEELSKETLKENYGISEVDAMLVFGNDLPYVIEFASQAFKKGIAKKMVICGGTGHSTERLRHAVASSQRYKDSYKDLKDKSEAEIYGKIAEDNYGISKDLLWLDTESTNCGENAKNGLKISGKDVKSILLIQDPILQLRSRASLEFHSGGEHVIISYAPFIPEVKEDLSFAMDIPNVWEFQRFMELVLGEIPRLKDDEYGYGPNGRNFIPHVDLPEEVLRAYKKVTKKYQELNVRKI